MHDYIDPTISWFEMWADAKTLAKRDWMWRKRLKDGPKERAAATVAQRLRRQSNPERARAYDREYYARDIQKSRAADKAKKRIQKQRDPIKWNAKNAANIARWRANNPKQYAAAMQRWRASHYEEFRAYCAEYYRLNPDAVKNANAQRRGAEGEYSKEDVQRLGKAQEGLCVYCHVELSHGFEVDHIVPISRGGSNWPSNIQLLCPSCNNRKRAMSDAEFRELMLT